MDAAPSVWAGVYMRTFEVYIFFSNSQKVISVFIYFVPGSTPPKVKIWEAISNSAALRDRAIVSF